MTALEQFGAQYLVDAPMFNPMSQTFPMDVSTIVARPAALSYDVSIATRKKTYSFNVPAGNGSVGCFLDQDGNSFIATRTDFRNPSGLISPMYQPVTVSLASESNGQTVFEPPVLLVAVIDVNKARIAPDIKADAPVLDVDQAIRVIPCRLSPLRWRENLYRYKMASLVSQLIEHMRGS